MKTTHTHHVENVGKTTTVGRTECAWQWNRGARAEGTPAGSRASRAQASSPGEVPLDLEVVRRVMNWDDYPELLEAALSDPDRAIDFTRGVFALIDVLDELPRKEAFAACLLLGVDFEPYSHEAVAAALGESVEAVAVIEEHVLAWVATGLDPRWVAQVTEPATRGW